MLLQLAAITLLAIAAAMPVHAQHETPPAPATRSSSAAPEVAFAILKTSKLETRERLLFSGGRFGEKAETAFSAFLIRHGQSHFLFDTGLGTQVAQQYAADMPWWNRLFFRYDEPVLPVQVQLKDAGIGPIGRIVVSHAHWDHLSGLPDFPQAEVWLSEEEHGFVDQPRSAVGRAWPSQVSGPVRWKNIAFAHGPYEGFERSLDMFGDGRVVLVPMFGHTPGSVGMFLTVSSGKRYFFVGDVVWTSAALKDGRPKHWAARWFVDHDVDQTQAAIEKIRAVMQRDPGVVVVPAHDARVQAALGFFPAWVK